VCAVRAKNDDYYYDDAGAVQQTSTLVETDTDKTNTTTHRII
jgi:hypothetical protein